MSSMWPLCCHNGTLPFAAGRLCLIIRARFAGVRGVLLAMDYGKPKIMAGFHGSNSSGVVTKWAENGGSIILVTMYRTLRYAQECPLITE
jgi:hypothetical protein